MKNQAVPSGSGWRRGRLWDKDPNKKKFSPKNKRQVLPHNQSWERMWRSQPVMWRFGYIKFPPSPRAGLRCVVHVRRRSQELSRSNTPLPPNFSVRDTKGNMRCGPHHEEEGKYWMFVLSSLYWRWQPPLFWGLSKHTFTTNNHGRVGTPAFQPHALRRVGLFLVKYSRNNGNSEQMSAGRTVLKGIHLRRPGRQTIRRVSQHETATSFTVFPLKVPLDGK